MVARRLAGRMVAPTEEPTAVPKGLLAVVL